MRKLSVEKITETVAEMCQEANYFLSDDMKRLLLEAYESEESPAGREALTQIIENYRVAAEEKLPICQDTGFAVFFVSWGQETMLEGGTLDEAINRGVEIGYREGYLRMSIVDDPLYDRKNTGTNTPAVIHTELVPGEEVKITFMPKGAGSENMSAVAMLKPSDGEAGVIDFVAGQMKKAGPNPCPPVLVGVGIGGTFDHVALLAKKALLRRPGQHHPLENFASLETRLLEEINRLGIGPQGFGGRIFALAVHIETYPCHIASMPVAVNLNCHVSRSAERVI